jgi:hypothetical protein
VTEESLAQPVGQARGPGQDRLGTLEAPYVLGKLLDRSISPVGVLLESPESDGVELVAHRPVEGAGSPRDLVVERRQRRGFQVLDVVRRMTGQQLVENDAERIDIRSGVDLS